MLKTVERSKLSDQVFRQLRDGILSEKFRSGERLPPERELCDLLQVNRSSVREALKRLEQARLIQTRQGEGSVVLDFRLNGGFDLLRDLVMPAGQVNPVSIRSIFEFRSLISPEIARLAALRIQDSDLEVLERIVEQIEACSPDDTQTVQRLDFEFHYTMAQASENLALLLILNSVKEIYFANRDYFVVMFKEVMRARDVYRRIFEALRARDAKRSQALCAELIADTTKTFWEHYGQADLAKLGVAPRD